MRFSLRWLFITIFLIALSVVALLYANVWWAGTARAAMFLVLPLGAIISIASSGTTRMFWLGFAIVGAAQFWGMSVTQGNAERPYLIWEAGINWLHSKVAREVPLPDWIEVPRISKPVPVVLIPTEDQFRAVSHCILSALLGTLGGYVAMWRYSRRDSRPAHSQKLEGSVRDHA